MATVRVLHQFAPDDIKAVRVLADSVEAATGAAPFGGDTWAGLEGHSVFGDVGFALDDESGALRAYAHLGHHHPGEWLLEVAAQDDARETLPALVHEAIETVETGGGGHLTFWAHGATSDDNVLATAAGFTAERDLLQMRVLLPLAEPVRWPDGVTVRTFRTGEDESAWLPVNNRAFAGHPEQGDWTIDTLQSREHEPWFDPEGFLLAFDDEGLAGFCWTKVHAPDPPREPTAIGEIYVIASDPRWHGRGLGRALTAAGLQSIAARGITTGMLYVDGANEAAVGLYRALGFTEHRVDHAYGRDVPPSSTP